MAMIAISALGDPRSMIPVIERIYPKASELSEILNYNPCPECGEVFHNPPNLEMHLAKYHRRESARPPPPPSPVIKQYYCPEAGCKYSGHLSKEFGVKFFTQHKYLKQHYIKVHMEKKFICDQCGKGFATLQLRRRHLEECGVKFVCSCGAEYNTIAALLTHASRKRHTFVKSWSAVRTRKTDNISNGNPPKQSAILPKCDSMVATAAVALGGVALNCQKSIDIAVQTEPTSQRRRRNTSRQTQTGEKRTRISSETQTMGELKKNTSRRRKKSMETQTKGTEPTSTVTSEESFTVKDIGLWLSSGTQTSTSTMFDNAEPLPNLSGTLFENEAENITNSTDKSDYFPDIITDTTDRLFSAFIKEELIIDDSKSCSIETQTEFSIESLFENFTDTFSNIETQTSHELWDTCTQTCDDILLAFSDIETQTDIYGETQNRH